MSLLAPRPQEIDRASFVLPTVTCSSCSAPIPLSSLGEHICRPAGRATGSRASPRPSQISIPSSNGPSRLPEPKALSRPVQDGSPTSRKPPANLLIPSRPSLSGLSPLIVPSLNGLYPSSSPSPRTPSPTNPFFPHPVQETPQKTQIVHGLGLDVGARREGPYPNDAPLTAVVPDLAMLDTANRNGAGMAGVGRRAFAAAAWSVRAGVALANSTHPPGQHSHQLHQFQDQQHSQPLSRAQSAQTQQVQPTAQSNYNPPSLPVASPTRPSWQDPSRRQMAKEPPLSPKAPLSLRERRGARPTAPEYIPHPHDSAFLPPRSASAGGHPSSGPTTPPRQRSASAMSTRPVAPEGRGSAIPISHSHTESRVEDTRSTGQSTSKLPFFERYKQTITSSSGPDTPCDSSSASSMRRESSDAQDERLVESPVQATLGLNDNYDEDQGSALPWATPLLAESPVIRQDLPAAGSSRLHNRHHTAESETSSSSSASSTSQSGRFGLTSGSQLEEVVTPSQSWERGLAERTTGKALPRSHSEDLKKGISYEISEENRDLLEQIGEEEEDTEEERVIFGANVHYTRRASDEAPTKGSISASTVTIRDGHSRSRTAPGAGRSSSSSTSRKTCQKCGEGVGGANRFVERDGVVLCERDWKKLYLPSCRRCNLPIEKSAVSASDGQLKGKWHRACFTCTRCDRPFEGDSFYVHGDRPWCQYHYHEEK